MCPALVMIFAKTTNMKHILLLGTALTLIGAATAQTPNTLRDQGFIYDPTAAGTLIYDFQEYDLNRVYALSDGKVMVVGSFRDVSYNTSGIMRLNSDGSFDDSFDAPDVDQTVFFKGRAFAELPNGQYLAGGSFQPSITGFITGLMRLNADGTQDTDFGAGLSYPLVQAIAVQPDGKILIGGFFSSLDFGANIARLNADGSIDDSFDTGTFDLRDVRDITLLTDGRMLVAGNFTSWPTPNGSHGTVGLALLNADGSLDTSFSHSAGTTFSVIVSAFPRVALQPDGKIVVASLSAIDSDIVQVRRYNSDFSLDDSFHVASNVEESGNYFTDVTVLSDGKILLSGYFINAYDGDGTVSGILRLNPDGTLDPTFDTNNGFGNGPQVYDCAVQSDGKILLFTINSEYQGEALTPNATNPVSQLVIRLNGDVPPLLSASDAAGLPFEMYPNPAHDFVQLSGLPQSAQVRIFDLQGRQVFKSTANHERQTIDVSTFPTGMYIVQITAGASQSARKLMIGY